MEELKKLLDTILDEELIMVVVSAPRTKEAYQRIRIRPVRHRGEVVFQAALWDGKKEFHRNYDRESLLPELLAWMSRDYRQLQAETTRLTASALVSKKGKVTAKLRHRQQPAKQADLEHNRTKRYLLPEGEPVPFLVKLGVMTPEGRVVKAKYDKFRQINRFLEFIEDICPVLARNRELTMIDFGCGKSYLTFAMYYYLHEKKGHDLRITGLDLKEDVIAHCNQLAAEFGYEKLQFLTGDIADYEGAEQVDLVVTLHACDTATDYALAKAVAWNARAILSVPCCQHELNRQITSEVLQPVLKYGLIKERMAALVTDGLRAAMLEECGYQVQVLEFIDMEHTPKNILIRAVKQPERIVYDRKEDRSAELAACIDFLHVQPTLHGLLPLPQLQAKRAAAGEILSDTVSERKGTTRSLSDEKSERRGAAQSLSDALPERKGAAQSLSDVLPERKEIVRGLSDAVPGRGETDMTQKKKGRQPEGTGDRQ